MSKHKVSRLRRLVAVEAARIMAEEGVQDFRLAKDKAVRRVAVGGDPQQILPSNAEVQEALRDHLAIFQGAVHGERLRRLRERAAEVMDWLADFDPRLTGAILEGTATEYAEIHLHLFAESLEQVIFFFLDQGRPYELGQHTLRFGERSQRELPCLRFRFLETPVHAMVFGLGDDRQTPASPVDGRPMRRARLRDLRRLLESGA